MRGSTRLLIQRINDLAGTGMTRNEVADALGLAYHTVVKHALDHGISFKRKGRATASNDRNREICERYLKGERQIDLSVEFGITRERVRQIIERAGLVSETKRHEDYVAVVAGTVSRKGLTLLEASEFFKTAKANIYLYCRQHGVRAARMTAEEIAELESAASEVVSGKSIRQAAHCSRSTEHKVSRYLKKKGIAARGRSRHDDFSERRSLLKKWRAQGASWRKCAELLSEHDGREISGGGLYIWAAKHMPSLCNGRASKSYENRASEWGSSAAHHGALQ